jgi:glucose/arabinose dehydrogenase
MLVTERPGRLRVVRDGVLLDAPVAGVPAVHARKQGGLFEAVPHPDFAANRWLYLTFAMAEGDRNTLALARGRLEETQGGYRLDGVETLFVAEAWRDTNAHYGGRMAWAPDGTLLLTSGEGYTYRLEAQALDSHFGKVLRLTEDGGAAPGNPFVGREDALPDIWSYGHRNPQGIDIAPDGTVYLNEHGARGGDEINIVRPGRNYGWPAVTYGLDYSGARYSPWREGQGTEPPLTYWTPSIAPSSLLVYDGTAFPQWQGRLMSAALAGKHIRIVDPAAPADQLELLSGRGDRVRDVAVGPDGELYATTETKEGRGGQVLRIIHRR